jgi:hypothetical protein
LCKCVRHRALLPKMRFSREPIVLACCPRNFGIMGVPEAALLDGFKLSYPLDKTTKTYASGH